MPASGSCSHRLRCNRALAIGVAVAHLFRGLLKQVCGQHHVALCLRLVCHALKSAETNGAMADRD